MCLNKPKPAHLQTGSDAEQHALNFLQKQGLKLVERNYRCKYGELDLIMQDHNVLVIVEVRYRKSAQFGGALASITTQKQARIIAATQHYVIINRLSQLYIRFDVVAFSGDYRPEWIKNAFLS